MTCAISACNSGGGTAAATFTAALQFFAATQCLIGEPWPKSASVADGSHFDFIIVGAGTAGSTLAARLAQVHQYNVLLLEAGGPPPEEAIVNGSHFDFIIVGAGTAGSTLAARLAQVHQYNVLLLEAGGPPPEEAIIPGFRNVLKSSPYDWNFTTVNDGFSSQGLRGGSQVQPRGKMLGGTGSINDMVYSRGNPADYYEWANIVGNVWNWTNVLEYFKKTERMTDENIINNSDLMKLHGCCGEIEVTGPTEPSHTTNKFLEAFNELGHEIVDDMTNPYEIGTGRFSHTIRNGRRDSSLTALLNNMHTDNLKVMHNALVTKILIRNNNAVGVTAIVNGEVVEYYADKEVVLSAGTFNTPKLMMLSGLGPKHHLQELGIEVIKEMPVGNNLHDHVMVLNYLAIKNGTCTVEKNDQYFEVIKYLYNFSGIFSQSDSMGVYLPKKNDESKIPYFAIYPNCMPRDDLTMESCLSVLGYDETVCKKLITVNQEHELIVLPVVLLKPQSRGEVRLKSLDPFEDPLIYSGAFNNLADYDGYSDAIRAALSLVNTTYFKSQDAHVLDFIWSNCSTIEDEENRIRCMVRDYAMPAWHAVGTAAMGSVVDAKLRVLDIRGLRVVDASVMPVVVRGNTNAPVVMIAEKAADFIKDAYKVRSRLRQ